MADRLSKSTVPHYDRWSRGKRRGPVARADGRSLAVTAREQWGANESYRSSRHGELWPEMFVPAKKLVIHHTATRNDYATAAEAAAEVRAIYYYHAVTQRWGDVGYGAFVDRFGNIYEGRHGRGGDAGDTVAREILSEDVVAGHDYAHNYGSVGVALLGDATRPDWPMPSAKGPMWDALVRFGVFEAARHGIRPLRPDGTPARSDFLRSDNLWTNAMNEVSGHRETNSTACPGEIVMELLPLLRSAVHSGLADVSRTAVTLTNTAPVGREAPVNTAISYSWQPEPPETGWSVLGYEYSVEGWSKASTGDDVTYLSGYMPEKQPRQRWSEQTAAKTVTFTPTQAGHYTLHVRPVLGDGSVRRHGAYEANHTYLVKGPKAGGKSSVFTTATLGTMDARSIA